MGIDLDPTQPAQPLQPGNLDQVTGTQDADPVANRFDLAELVRTEEDGLAPFTGLADRGAEHAFHQRVQSAARFIQDQYRCQGRERCDQGHLLPVPRRIGPGPFGRALRSNWSTNRSR